MIPKIGRKLFEKVLEWALSTFYMFHGGTNFGFHEWLLSCEELDLPQVTSYDYDALLDEGNPTAPNT